MLRTTEPELMLDQAQVVAYAAADFAESDNQFVLRFFELFGSQRAVGIMDLGCGPGNITLLLAAACPDCDIVGVDGSAAMLAIASDRASEAAYNTARVRFVEVILPDKSLADNSVQVVVSNSLLHHLHDPAVLWQAMAQAAAPGAAVLVRDLRRPESKDKAREIVSTYAGDAPEVLQLDFYNSLLAAFEVEEVVSQLSIAGLDGLQVSAVSDRYLEVSGRLP